MSVYNINRGEAKLNKLARNTPHAELSSTERPHGVGRRWMVILIVDGGIQRNFASKYLMHRQQRSMGVTLLDRFPLVSFASGEDYSKET